MTDLQKIRTAILSETRRLEGLRSIGQPVKEEEERIRTLSSAWVAIKENNQ